MPAICEVLANRDNIHVLENFIYGDTPEKHSISQLLHTLKENQDFAREIKTVKLANELNIRILPLKTLLVYLAMEGIIRPKWTYFEEYSFKYKTEPTEIIGSFEGERKQFVTAVINHCHTRKVWTTIDIPAILESYPFLEVKNWITDEYRR